MPRRSSRTLGKRVSYAESELNVFDDQNEFLEDVLKRNEELRQNVLAKEKKIEQLERRYVKKKALDAAVAAELYQQECEQLKKENMELRIQNSKWNDTVAFSYGYLNALQQNLIRFYEHGDIIKGIAHDLDFITDKFCEELYPQEGEE